MELFQEGVAGREGGFFKDSCDRGLGQIRFNLALDAEVIKTLQRSWVGLEKTLLGKQSVSHWLLPGQHTGTGGQQPPM